MISKANPLAFESLISGKQLRLDYCADAFLRFVHEPGSVVHVFVKDATAGSHRHYVGYYDTDHLKKLWQDVKQFSGRAAGIYYSLGRAKNCLKLGWEAKAAQNFDILRRR